jgi:hypothetical protein
LIINFEALEFSYLLSMVSDLHWLGLNFLLLCN